MLRAGSFDICVSNPPYFSAGSGYTAPDERCAAARDERSCTLEDLCAARPMALTDATTLLILSDAKTVDQMRAVRHLMEAKRLAGRVIWLNPIPEHKWHHLKSTQAFAQVCTMVSCSTLGALAAACRKLAD